MHAPNLLFSSNVSKRAFHKYEKHACVRACVNEIDRSRLLNPSRVLSPVLRAATARMAIDEHYRAAYPLLSPYSVLTGLWTVVVTNDRGRVHSGYCTLVSRSKKNAILDFAQIKLF
jgi:hypothetical protein